MRLSSLCFFALAFVAGCSPSPSGMDGASPPGDSGSDSGSPIDSGFDAGPPDAGQPDAGGDGGTDAGPGDAGDAGDGGPRDSGVDAGADAGFVNVVISDWCYDQGWAICAREVRCGSLASANLPECIGKKRLNCDQTAFTRAVNEGRLAFAAATAAKCLNGYATGSCEEPPAGCDAIFTGNVPPDGGCLLNEECERDAGYCEQYDYRCPHRCFPWLPVGGDCYFNYFGCKPDESYCGTADGGGQRCLPVKNEGEPCTDYYSCHSNLVCAGGTCLKRFVDVGESCGVKAGAPYCHTEFFCRQDTVTMPTPPGTCQARAGLGGVCVGYGACLPSLRCGSDFTTSTCVPRAALGQPCAAYGDCEDTLYCANKTSHCEKVPGDGGDCTSAGSDYQCASTHFCDFYAPGGKYTCRPLSANGEGCFYGGCISKNCQMGLPDGGGICVAGCSDKADGGF